MIVGSGAGGIEVGERQYREFFTDGLKKVTPYAIPVSIVGMVSSEISIALRLHGISHVLSTGCTSSTDAVGYALSLLRDGEYDALLSGGVDACVTPGMIYGFARMRVMSTHYNDHPGTASRPFDRGRDGFVLGEGAWMLVLEREDTARARGATVYAWVEGYASTCDAYHRVQMDPDGGEIVRAMRTAIERAERPAESIGYVNYHGTSTQLNDAIEVACVKRVFGGHARAPAWLVDQVDDRPPAGRERRERPGHGRAGAAPRRAAADHQPARSRSRLRSRFHPNASRPGRVEAALCNCLGFGSKNSAIVLGAPDVVGRWCDVLIAGAGPAGSIAAIRLARAGARVLLVDRARFPRDKLCGDTLNPGAMRVVERAGLRARVEAASLPLEGMLITERQRRAGARDLRSRAVRPGAHRAACSTSSCSRPRSPPAPVPGRRAGRRRRWSTRPAASRRVRGAVLACVGDAEAAARAGARSRWRPTAGDRCWRSRSGSRRSRRRSGAGRSAPISKGWTASTPWARCTSAVRTTSACRRSDGGLANVCLVAPAARGVRRSGAAARARLAADPLLGPRAARARRVTPALDARAARRRRSPSPACPACCSPAMPPASSIR